MSPKVSSHACPAVAAQMVWATSGTPSRAKSSAVSPAEVRAPADEL